MAEASPQDETPAQRQARIRREKREKKILAGGSDRLAKISNVSGRSVESAPSTTLAPDLSSPAPDPEEPDIHAALNASRSAPSTEATSQRDVPTEAELRAFLRAAAPDPSDTIQQLQQQQEPDMMALFQQMMSGAAPPPSSGAGGTSTTPGGAMPSAGPDLGGLPPALAAMLGGAPGGAPAPSQAKSTQAYLWKILHALSAFTVAGWILYTYPFSGTLAARNVDPSAYSQTQAEAGGGATSGAIRVFYVFATVQLLLQSTRYFLDREADEVGMIATVAGFLPVPWSERLRLVGRYGGIWTTLVGDAMVVVWVLGVMAWWRGVSS